MENVLLRGPGFGGNLRAPHLKAFFLLSPTFPAPPLSTIHDLTGDHPGRHHEHRGWGPCLTIAELTRLSSWLLPPALPGPRVCPPTRGRPEWSAVQSERLPRSLTHPQPSSP